jgi:DnaK suppressor protein
MDESSSMHFGIKAALKRLETDEYGYCTECGEAINHKRLEIDLAVTHCIGCAF